MPAFALTIFTGAFLLFQVQPLLGKYILPWFGGGPGVWTTCMLFFQAVLLAGYAYAHFSARCLKPRAQVVTHLVLISAALALLPIIPGETWKPRPEGNPTLQILVLLAADIGLPYFVLSATGPLVQHWFSQARPGASPYRLYALSNTGSLLALITFPFFFEPHFTRHTQATLWAGGLAVYAVCCGWCARMVWKGQRHSPKSKVQSPKSHAIGPELQVPSQEGGAKTGRFAVLVQKALWLLLPACASALLLAVTNKLCQDVAVIPFLWVLPLALYLLSFIICFDSPRWYVRFPFTLAFVAALGGLCWALFHGNDLSLPKQVALYAASLFVCCMVCHGELYRLRPEPSELTEFYLMIAAGGALGGAFVAIAAPLVFTNYYELHWGLLLCGVLFVVACARDWSAVAAGSSRSAPRLGDSWTWLACILSLFAFGGLDWLLRERVQDSAGIPQAAFLGARAVAWLALLIACWIALRKYRACLPWRRLTCLWLSLGVLVLGRVLWMHGHRDRAEVVSTSRNFYGVLTVYEHRQDEPDGHHFLLQHGRITHGLQFVDRERAVWPTTYYGEASGIGLALNALPPVRRIGLVGLGTGTLLAYGRPGDSVRIYEINPEVPRLATSRFTYLANCPAKTEIVLGDARLSMEREPAQDFDLLALDAFSSDAIPVHLLTKEAFELYARHLKPQGILAVHISNHYLDLEPVVLNLARHFHYSTTLVDSDEDDATWWQYGSTWILLTHDAGLLQEPTIQEAASPQKTNSFRMPLWTDDFASLFPILK